jgi:hypothetical protein
MAYPSGYMIPFGGIIAAIIAILLQNRIRRRVSSSPYPPGPKSVVMPTHDAWIRYQEWGREYGQFKSTQNQLLSSTDIHFHQAHLSTLRTETC